MCIYFRRFLQKAFQFWARVGKLKATFITALQTHVGTENNAVSNQQINADLHRDIRLYFSPDVMFLL